MAVNLPSYDHADEDYIDMEISSFPNSFCHSVCSPPHTREFEFQMSSSSMEREPTTSPADELFYKGKLLPLHLPPRLQMFEKLLENSNSIYEDNKDNFDEFYSTPLATTLTTPTTTSTPFESCNISPSESCQVSRELNPEEYFFEYPSDESGFIGEHPKKSWTKKLKLIRQSSIGSKLKASRAYLKALFGKSGCSDESCAAAAKVADEGSIAQARERQDKYMKAAKKSPIGRKEKYQIPTASMRSFDKAKITEENAGHHRRSFSLAIKRHPTKRFSPVSSSSDSSSSSSSNYSNRFHALQFLKRSNSMNSEIENPIQGAIAHCKQSQ
ncbi:hypothetical protein SLEP1_g37576 [Rubroshorea leprosula]|uniref:Membrane-associated kinase regulator 4 n=1 Tax=Rubroshorea leprosula TaxID=152421 RepID=A0AAV5KV35_9ROSI|nr:hypothetical protein SLEP1_g37576 [Rubroshorea leprosula]